MPLTIFLLVVIAALLVVGNKLYKFRKHQIKRNCRSGYESIRERIKNTFRYNVLNDVEEDLWRWHLDYDTRVETGQLEKWKRELLELLSAKRELLKRRSA